MLPNFLIIGAPRSGTTYLLNCFRHHPDIFIPKHGYTGDIHFFDTMTSIALFRNFSKGITWYKKQFAGCGNEKAVGEKTAYYFSDPSAPRLIHQYLPAVKLVVILRNPVDRAYSDFWYHRGEFPIKTTFLDVCRRDHKRLKIIQVGLYNQHLQNYLKYFAREQFHFILYDNLHNNPLDELKKVFAFLEVNPDFIPASYHCRVNPAGGKGNLAFLGKLFGIV